MGKFKKTKKEEQFKHHKKYRWIALALKLISGPIFTYIFSGLTIKVTLRLSGEQTLGTFLATLLTLIVYYGVIFFLNRSRNFKSHTSLTKSIAVYVLMVIILMSLETIYSGIIQNILYRVTHLGLKDPLEAISVANVKHPGVYLLLGFGVHFAFGYVTGILIYFLFKNVLDKEEVLAKI